MLSFCDVRFSKCGERSCRTELENTLCQITFSRFRSFDLLAFPEKLSSFSTVGSIFDGISTDVPLRPDFVSFKVSNGCDIRT